MLSLGVCLTYQWITLAESNGCVFLGATRIKKKKLNLGIIKAEGAGLVHILAELVYTLMLLV